MRRIFPIVRSELTRIRRRGIMIGWFGLTAMFSAIFATIVFKSAVDGGGAGPKGGPGAGMPTLGDLTGSHGLVVILGSTTRIVGVITLSYWAVATATDYSSGLIRLLAQAEPRRARLLAGKAAALALWTALVTTIATTVTVAASPLLARANDIPTTGWSANIIGTVAAAWLHAYLALLVWGSIGLVIATLARSSAVAIAVGVGYVLVVESVIGLVAGSATDWLPGSILTSLAKGGDTVSFPSSVAVATGYALVGLTAAATILTRRDITE